MWRGAETKRSLHKGVTLMWTLVVLHLVAAPTLILVLRTWSMVLTFVTCTLGDFLPSTSANSTLVICHTQLRPKS